MFSRNSQKFICALEEYKTGMGQLSIRDLVIQPGTIRIGDTVIVA